MKTCNKCAETKQLSEYYTDKNAADGKRSDCKACKNASTYKWREENKDFYNKSMRDYQAAHAEQRDDTDLRRKYGVSKAWYDQTFEAQGKCCAICKKENTSTKRRFPVDHDHKTGAVRGIICYNCNRLLSIFDTTDLLEKAKNYLKKGA